MKLNNPAYVGVGGKLAVGGEDVIIGKDGMVEIEDKAVADALLASGWLSPEKLEEEAKKKEAEAKAVPKPAPAAAPKAPEKVEPKVSPASKPVPPKAEEKKEEAKPEEKPRFTRGK